VSQAVSALEAELGGTIEEKTHLIRELENELDGLRKASGRGDDDDDDDDDEEEEGQDEDDDDDSSS
jgi:hypothetical protein